MGDDQRPTLALTNPVAGANETLTRLLVGMADYHSGLDMKTFRVTADFAVDGLPPGTDLAGKFQAKSQGVWEMRLASPIAKLQRGTLTISVRDRQGNVSRIERVFSVAAK